MFLERPLTPHCRHPLYEFFMHFLFKVYGRRTPMELKVE
jgi:hypothetical protein